ncbi:MAG TPA: DUF433 domain-containing protein [Thermomicrobiales bacterium]|nr:DUF433 domain-containing protein [Thermomicrobiales bacterium]
MVEGAGGPKARIAGHRIRVQDIVVMHEQLGQSVDEIVEQLPTITKADVYAALAYYWDNREEIEAKMAQDHAYVEEMRLALGPSPLEGKLRHLRSGEPGSNTSL